MNEKIENLRIRLTKRLEEANQEAYYARSSDENYYHRTRAEELTWCLNEITTILQEGNVS